MTPPTPNSTAHFRGQAAILFALIFPTALTWVYFIALDGSSPLLQKSAFGVGKVIQFAFPLVWILLVKREQLQFRRLETTTLLMGAAFGLTIFGAILALYYGLIRPRGMFPPDVADEVRDKLAAFGVTSLVLYVGLAAFYSLVHSLLEEYYWRWFVYGQLRQQVSVPLAVMVSSLGFMAHHVLVIGKYFGWTSLATLLFSLSVAVGGSVWALLYERGKNLFAPWLSHLLIDAAIFVVGYDLVQTLLQ